MGTGSTLAGRRVFARWPAFDAAVTVEVLTKS